MAMLISRFHKLIQSRLVWAIIIVVIVFAFVVFFTPGLTASDTRADLSPGSLEGEDVPREEFRRAYMHSYLGLALMYGGGMQISTEIDRMLNDAAWKRIAMLRTARDLGFIAVESDVVASIQQNPSFQREGRFEPRVYQWFVEQILGPMGFSPAQFEAYVREEILIQKLTAAVQEGVLVAPAEIEHTLEALTDMFRIAVFRVTSNDVTAPVDVSEADVEALFDADPSAYRLPEQVRISMMRFPVDQYLQPEEPVSADELLDAYQEHLEDYRIEAVADEGADEAGEAAAEAYRPLEEVEDEVRDRVRRARARERAAEAADEAVYRLAPDREGQAPSFEDVAAELDAEILDLEPFSRGDPPPQATDAPAFASTAFALGETPDDYFSYAVEGASEVYVLALRERIPARIPDLEQVYERVEADARREALREAMMARAEEIRSQIEEALDRGSAPDAALAQAEAVPGLYGPFSIAQGLAEEDERPAHHEFIMRSIGDRNAGEFTEATPIDEEVLLVYVIEREPGEAMRSSPDLSEEIRSVMLRERRSILVRTWQEDLLADMDFQPSRRSTEDADADEVPEDE
jgi:hypothetical protein